MDIYKELEKKAKKKIRTIIFPESYDERILNAVKTILKKKFARVVLISRNEKTGLNIDNDKNLTVIDSEFSAQFLKEYYSVKQKKKPDFSQRNAEIDIKDPLIFSLMLLRNNFADGIVAGSVYSTSDVLRNAIPIIGLKGNNKTVSSFFLFNFPNSGKLNKKVIAFADCGVIPFPDSKQLSDIALQTADNFNKLTGIKPRLAFLSFSTKGSSKDPSIDKIKEAYKLTKRRKPDLICDAELQFDAAFVPEVALRKNPDGMIKGDANIFIFPDLNSGNIAYKITERIGGAFATGPIVQGLARPVMDLSRGCSSSDIINMTKVITNLI